MPVFDFYCQFRFFRLALQFAVMWTVGLLSTVTAVPIMIFMTCCFNFEAVVACVNQLLSN
jgi:hypothetical protein